MSNIQQYVMCLYFDLESYTLAFCLYLKIFPYLQGVYTHTFSRYMSNKDASRSIQHLYLFFAVDFPVRKPSEFIKKVTC